MFKSRAVAYVKPSSSCRTVQILAIGNGFLTIHLFTSLKSLTTRTVLSFFGIMNVGDAHWESSCHFSTLSYIVFVPPFWWSPHDSWVLEKAGHDMAVLCPLIGRRPAYNPSHLTSC